MPELEGTRRDIAFALLAPHHEGRIDALVDVVLSLLVEVEALREATMRLHSSAGPSAYLKAYRDTAFLSHNSAGPSGGIEKLIARFYPSTKEADGRSWREVVLLRRLGMADPEIEAYKKEAKGAELYT